MLCHNFLFKFYMIRLNAVQCKDSSANVLLKFSLYGTDPSSWSWITFWCFLTCLKNLFFYCVTPSMSYFISWHPPHLYLRCLWIIKAGTACVYCYYVHLIQCCEKDVAGILDAKSDHTKLSWSQLICRAGDPPHLLQLVSSSNIWLKRIDMYSIQNDVTQS